MSSSPSPLSAPPSALVEATRRLESASALDPLVGAVRPLADALVADPGRRALLRGAWLGHALHPLLTDAPIGMWISALSLDLVGGRQSRPAAQRLVGLGVLAAVPTALTGWAEWSGIGQREQRVGVVHAASNVVALGLFASSWRARRRGRYLRGRAVGLLGAGALGVGDYLGGHLVSARKVSSHDPSLAD